MFYYSFNISDFSQSTKHLSILERGIYRELIDLYYDKESPLVNDPQRLAKLICAPDNLTDVEQVLNEFFTLVDDVWINDRCEEVIDEYQKRLNTASKAGKASAKARAAKSKASKDVTTVERPLNDRGTNYKPLTKNHKPIKNIVIPDGINLDAYTEWLDYRKEKKKPVSQAAAKKQFAVLSEYTEKVQAEIINNSITNDYQGLFKPRANNENNKSNNQKPVDNSAAGRVRANVQRELRERQGAQVVDDDVINVRT